MARRTAPGPDDGITRTERVLAVMSLTVIGLSILCFLVLVISPVLGWTTAGNPLLTTITLLPLIGLPVGFVLLMALIVMNAVRRGRAARSAR